MGRGWLTTGVMNKAVRAQVRTLSRINGLWLSTRANLTEKKLRVLLLQLLDLYLQFRICVLTQSCQQQKATASLQNLTFGFLSHDLVRPPSKRTVTRSFAFKQLQTQVIREKSNQISNKKTSTLLIDPHRRCHFSSCAPCKGHSVGRR